MINGLEVVLPTGEICRKGSCALGNDWYTLHPLPDLNLFMGWSGSTGIITKVSLRLFPCKKIQKRNVFVVENENLVPKILFKLTHVGMTEDLVVVSQEIPPPFNRADQDTVSHACQALHETDERVLELGGTLWKPTVFGQKRVMDRMDANTREMMKKVKTLLDPNGIMNPGTW